MSKEQTELEFAKHLELLWARYEQWFFERFNEMPLNSRREPNLLDFMRWVRYQHIDSLEEQDNE